LNRPVLTPIQGIECVCAIVRSSNKNIDTVEQLMRRIDFIVYRQKIEEEYLKNSIPMSEYKGYNELIKRFDNVTFPFYCTKNLVR